MAATSDRVEAVVRVIEAAFADVPYPGDDKLVPEQCVDVSEVEHLFGTRRWQEVLDVYLENGYSSPSFFSAEAFQFFIPAYLIGVIRNFRSTRSATVEHLLYGLNPHGEPHSKRWPNELKLSKYALLTPEQHAAICAFLEYIRDSRSACSDLAEEALDAHWAMPKR